MTKAGVREIARLAGVSIGTVDRALHGRKEVSEKTREKILALADKIGYKPNLTARALAAGRATIRIGVVIPKEIRYFYDKVRDGILEEAQRFAHLGVEVLYEPIPRLGRGEEPAVRRMIKERVQAIVLTPGNPERMAPLIDQAEKSANIRVVCVSSDDSRSARSTAISVEPRRNGMLAAELLAKCSPSPARAAIVTGMLATEDHARKAAGFSAAFPGKVLAVIEGHENERETHDKVLRLLKSSTALNGLYVSTANCLPVCRALEESGRAGKVRLIVTDLFKDSAPYLRSGVITAAIDQRPYQQGQMAVRLLVDHFVRSAQLPPFHYLSPAILLLNNMGPLI